MYTLITALPLRSLLIEQAPAFGLSLILAELFYKFHSFTLETMAFLVTWLAADGVISFVRRLRRG